MMNRWYGNTSLRSSARYEATVSSTVNFANSAGCNFSGPRSKLSAAPPLTAPTRMTSTSSMIVTP